MIASDGGTEERPVEVALSSYLVFVRFVYELMMSPGRDECLLGDCGVMVMTMNL